MKNWRVVLSAPSSVEILHCRHLYRNVKKRKKSVNSLDYDKNREING